MYIDENQANESRCKKRMNEKKRMITKRYIEKRREILKNYLKKKRKNGKEKIDRKEKQKSKHFRRIRNCWDLLTGGRIKNIVELLKKLKKELKENDSKVKMKW